MIITGFAIKAVTFFTQESRTDLDLTSSTPNDADYLTCHKTDQYHETGRALNCRFLPNMDDLHPPALNFKNLTHMTIIDGGSLENGRCSNVDTP